METLKANAVARQALTTAAGGGAAARRDFALARLVLTADMLAHLRAVAEGLAPADAARRYLRARQDGGALAAHRRAVDTAAAVARRSGLGARWRLLRLPALATPALASGVALEEWAEQHGYEGFSFEEIRALYEERHGPLRPGRKQAQVERLRRQRLALLDELARHAVPSPTIADPVAAWFSEDTAARLHAAGFVALAELRTAIAQGGRWWRHIRAFGPLKAAALAEQVALLVGGELPGAWRADERARQLAAQVRPALASWLNARTQSAQTERAYRREIERFTIWLAVERDRAFDAAGSDDCSAYIRFLQSVPSEWISRRRSRRFADGWAPFFEQPGAASQRYALTVLAAFYAWLASAGELARNPWRLVNLRLPDAAGTRLETSHAFTPEGWAALLAHADRLPSAAGDRMGWLLRFALATGLRAAELLAATRGDLYLQDGGWWLRVHGKGARNRAVPVPSGAMLATHAYFSARGLDFAQDDPEAPLLAAIDVPGASLAPVPYPTLADSFKRFVTAALAASSLPQAERSSAQHASLHWLRHTHATRAVEAGVPPDVLQANLGHSDPRVTARYYRAQEKRRMAQMERAFGAVAGSDAPG